jgi:hypothetical protein
MADGTMMSASEYFDQPNASATADAPTDDQYGEADTGDDAGDPLSALQAKFTAPIPGAGELLEEPKESKVFKTIEKEVKRVRRLRKNRAESAKHWDAVKSGASFSVLEKSEDQSVWKQSFPLDVEGTPAPIPNKVADICNKMRNQVLIDVPLPNPIADGDDDRARQAADVTKKFLRANATPDAMNEAALLHMALDLNMTQRSSFVFVWTDPMGGGWKPKQIKAHPQAEDPKNPLVGPKMDPATGLPVQFQGPGGQPVTITERTTDPILRYVAETSDETGQTVETFTKNPSEAARQWMPKLRARMLTAPQVVTIPRTADVFSAHSIVLVLWETLGEAKRRFEILTALSDDQVKRLCKWRPDKWEMIVPEAHRPKKGGEDDEAGEIHDDTLFFWYHKFCRADQGYMDGAQIAVNGGINNGFVLLRDTLREDVDLEDGTTVPVVMRPPVTQFKGLNDPNGGDPFGLEPISLFGGANDLYAHLYTAILEQIDKGLHPNVYIPATSPVTREEYNRRDGTPIEILVPEDKPFTEPGPQPTPYAMDILDRVDHAMNSLAGTNETSNGLDSPYAISGEAKKVAINQAKVGLKQYWHNTMNGCTYLWLICTEQAQAKLTVPQQIQLTGNDSAYKQRYFVGADMVGITKIALEPGSATMMSSPEKVQWLGQMQDRSWVDAEQAGELARASMSDDLGLPPNPHEEFINRCIADWVEGPPEGWEEDYKRNMQMKQQYEAASQQMAASSASGGQDPQAPQGQQQGAPQGQPQAPPVPPPQYKPIFTPFEPRPNDEDPFVAKIVAGKMSRFMSSTDYKKHPVSWRSTFDDAYRLAFYNAGGQTVKQQADAAAQQAQAAQPASPDAEQPTFQQFVQNIGAKVLSAAESSIAKEVAAETGVSGAPPPAPDAGINPLEVMAKAQESDAARQHDAQQAQLQRAHTSAEKAHDRAHDVRKHAITIAAKSHDNAQQMSAPKPIGGPSADPRQDTAPARGAPRALSPV